MQNPTQYEYKYRVGPATWQLSLANGLLSSKTGFAGKTIQQGNITAFAIGSAYIKSQEIDRKTSPQNTPPGIAQLLVVYQDPEAMKKKLMRIGINTAHPHCKEALKSLHEKHRHLYIGSGNIFKISKELGFQQHWQKFLVLGIIIFTLISGFIAYFLESQ